MDEAKEDMVDVVKFLQNPEAFEQVGAKIPKGQEKVNVNIERSRSQTGLINVNTSIHSSTFQIMVIVQLKGDYKGLGDLYKCKYH